MLEWLHGLHGRLECAAMLAMLLGTSGLDDGLAQSPPMGWRSWNQFGLLINQSLMEQQFEALAERSRVVDGQPTSLLDLGYQHAAIDDGWQLCNSGPGGKGFHNATGYPIVNTSRFPSMTAMTAKARSLGLRAGWYENNAHCADHEHGSYTGLVQSTLDFGFQGIKMDRAGRMTNASEVAALFNASGSHVLQENNDAKAHRGAGGGVVCPMHFFRTGFDIRPTHGSVVKGMQSVRQYNEDGLTGPGCWAHADMLSVGVTEPQPPGAKHICSTATARCSLNWTEMRSNFGAWCVISNPLVLAMDLRNKSALDRVWPIISNTEAIAVNQQWAGDSGRLLAQSSTLVILSNCGSGTPCKVPRWMVWSKALPPPHGQPRSSRAALYLLNNDVAIANVSASLMGVRGLGACGSTGCSVRAVWDRSDLPVTCGDGLVSAVLEPHDSALFVVTSPSPPPPPPLPPSPPPPVGHCVTPNVLYDSKLAGNQLLDGKVRLASNSSACQEICHATQRCVCFSHRKSLDHCWLHLQCQHPEPNTLYDSGTAVC